MTKVISKSFSCIVQVITVRMDIPVVRATASQQEDHGFYSQTGNRTHDTVKWSGNSNCFLVVSLRVWLFVSLWPCEELALVQCVTLPSPHGSWDRFHSTPWPVSFPSNPLIPELSGLDGKLAKKNALFVQWFWLVLSTQQAHSLHVYPKVSLAHPPCTSRPPQFPLQLSCEALYAGCAKYHLCWNCVLVSITSNESSCKNKLAIGLSRDDWFQGPPACKWTMETHCQVL